MYFLLSFLMGFIFCSAQKENTMILEVLTVYGKKIMTISEEKPFVLDKENGLEISKLKFYLSHFEFYEGNRLVYSEQNSFHLIDASNNNTLKLKFSLPQNLKYNRIAFLLGIDKKTNNEGIQGGDLDPTKGMYWAWQSGYINFKLEGKSNRCPTRNNEFSFHLGGFLDPFYASQLLEFSVDYGTLHLLVDLEKLISVIDLSKQNSIMTPSKESVEISKKLVPIFSIINASKEN